MKLHAAALTVLALAAGLSAQTAAPKLKGSFILTEDGSGSNGQAVSSIYKLELSETGAVTGREATRSNGEISIAEVQGSYTLKSDSTGTLTLSTYFTDENGAGQNAPKSFALLTPPSGDINAIRVNAGFYATGVMVPAAASAAGSYLFRDRAAGRASARIAQVVLDATGNVSGVQFLESVAGVSRQALKGTYQTEASGFSSLTVSAESADENGDAVVARESYLFLASAGELYLLRSDNGPAGVFTMAR